MIPADYELADADIAMLGDLIRFESHALDTSLFHHLDAGRLTYTPLATAFAPHWHKVTNPVGWPNFKPLAHRDVNVTVYGCLGEAADWCDGMKFDRKPLIVATPVETDTFAPSVSISYVLRFKHQKDAAMFRLIWSDWIGI